MCLIVLGLAFLLAPVAHAQPRPYIGFAYPAGGKQGTTFQVKLGGQGLEDVHEVFVTGTGVTAKVVEYNRVLNPQEITLLNEQLRELKRSATETSPAMMDLGTPMMADNMMASVTASDKSAAPPKDADTRKMIARIEKRVAECVNRPASVALASIVYIEVTIAPDASPGQRELRLGTLRGISNPLVFHVGQLREFSRKPMITAPLQVLGKEELALRKRPATEVEDCVTTPCTLNGQVASGEVNRYRFEARKGQRLVITTQARQLIPFIADAVPGWFQPVLVLYDANGKEVAYDDDYRFKPDPTILYQVPKDGEYVLAIYDSIYRGREDFVYRITLGEMPFITSIFPLGGRAGAATTVQMKGWNLGASSTLTLPADAPPGIYRLTATNGVFVSNPVPFALDTLPEALDQEPNNTQAQAPAVKLPVMINGRIDQRDDWDVFQFMGKADETIVAEVYARRLDSPLDSVLKLTDSTGKLLAYNDDHEDLGAGANTHDADSYLMATLPADGTYYIHIGDTARNGGEEYGYRLRLSNPQPDFALRAVPSSISMRGKSSAVVSVYLMRKDGFAGPVKLGLKNPPAGFTVVPVSISGTQTVARLTVRSDLVSTKEPVNLTIMGSAKIEGQEIVREAVPAEDRMQAFLWRHLVPASELKALAFDPSYQLKPKRVPRARPSTETETKPAVAATDAGTNKAAVATNGSSTNKPPAATADSSTNKPKFTKQQVAGRLRQLKLLFEEGLLTDDFHARKVAECEAAQ